MIIYVWISILYKISCRAWMRSNLQWYVGVWWYFESHCVLWFRTFEVLLCNVQNITKWNYLTAIILSVASLKRKYHRLIFILWFCWHYGGSKETHLNIFFIYAGTWIIEEYWHTVWWTIGNFIRFKNCKDFYKVNLIQLNHLSICSC